MSYHGRNSDPAIQVLLRDWGGWRRTLGAAAGWGAATLEEKAQAPVRNPGAYSDPTFARYFAAHACGDGVLQFVDRRMAEHYAVVRAVMVARYVELWHWEVVAKEAQSTVADARLLHDRCCGNLHQAVKIYLESGSDPQGMSTYGSMFRVWKVKRKPEPEKAPESPSLRHSVS